MRMGFGFRIAAGLLLCGSAFAAGQQASEPVVLDRVVAVVNRKAILSSDIAEEIHMTVLEPPTGQQAPETSSAALDRLVSRTLIQQQIREEDAQTSSNTEEAVRQRVVALRRTLPACARMNCSTDAGWSAFLSANRLTDADVERYMRARVEILNFIEDRFRAGIRNSQDEIEHYYRDTLLPQYGNAQKPPQLEEVSKQIDEILLQQKVNALFSAWLENLRKQGDVEILDPAYESPQAKETPPGE